MKPTIITHMIEIPPLPYAYDALEPALSKHQVQVHYDKHTVKYYDTVNELIKGTSYADVTSIKDLLTKKTLSSADSVLFNNAAQAWNHTFFWSCFTPDEKGQQMPDALEDRIMADFDSVAAMKKIFIDKATQHFGSGWCWIVLKNGKLIIKTTPNATTPLVTAGEYPLAVIDLWEHAYLYDPQYEADKAAYINNMWPLLDWNAVYANLRFA
jgi:superoxide dismutase, Fe-Mn family